MELEQSLAASVSAVRSLFGAAACSCALVRGDGDELEFVAADGSGADAITGVRIPVGRGIAGWAAMSGQPIAVRDVADDARFARDVAESTEYVPSSILAAPLMSREGETLGVVEVLDPSVDQASDWTLAVLGTLASQLALLVETSGPQDAGDEAARRLAATLRSALAAYDDTERP